MCGEFRDTSTSGTKELDIDNVAGIFFVLAGGSAFAMLVCLAEVIAIKFRNSRNKVRTKQLLICIKMAYLVS